VKIPGDSRAFFLGKMVRACAAGYGRRDLCRLSAAQHQQDKNQKETEGAVVIEEPADHGFQIRHCVSSFKPAEFQGLTALYWYYMIV